MIFGLSHIDVPVKDMRRSTRFFCEGLGFSIKGQGEGWVDLDASTMLVRLIETKRPDRVVRLRFECSDVNEDVQAVINAGGRLIYEPARTESLTIESTLNDPDGHIILIWRNLTEDEYGFDPELPTEMVWEADAEDLLKSLLKAVPALFRGLARRKIVAEAERRAGLKKRVDRDLMIRSFISAQAPPNRKRLHAPLRDHGINPADYQDEFDG